VIGVSENTGNNTAEAGEQQPGQEQSQTFTQDDVNRIVQDRLQREREKYADYDELKTAAERAQELEAQTQELTAKVAEFESKEEHRKLVADVAETAGVPAGVLKGDTREELEAHAEALKSLLQNTTGPVIPGQEKRPHKVEESDERKAVKGLFGG
jgi:pimeloyl-CoA synthetase